MAAARDFDSVDASNTTGLGCSYRTSGSLFSYVELEARVPAKHLIRTISEIVNDVLVWLIAEFERIYKARGREQADRRGACAHARLALEMVVNWFCRSDSKLRTHSRPRCSRVSTKRRSTISSAKLLWQRRGSSRISATRPRTSPRLFPSCLPTNVSRIYATRFTDFRPRSEGDC